MKRNTGYFVGPQARSQGEVVVSNTFLRTAKGGPGANATVSQSLPHTGVQGY